MKRIIFHALVLLLITSCSRLTFVSDPWFNTIWQWDGSGRFLFYAQGAFSGAFPSLQTAETAEQFDSIISSDEDVFVVSPYFVPWLRTEEGKKYIILNGFYDLSADNVVAVYSDRTDSYVQAGEFCAASLGEEGNAAALFYTGTEARLLEMEAFIEGFTSLLDRERLVLYQAGDLSDESTAVSFLENSQSPLYFLSASSLNPALLNRIENEEALIGGENLAPLLNLDKRILFSVENNRKKMIQTAVKLGLDGLQWENQAVPSVLIERRN